MTAPVWPPGNGEMARHLRAHDWSATTLGPIEAWPAILRTMVDVVLAMPSPASILWGPAGVQLYNDAYIAIAKDRHPILLGLPVAEGWPDAYEGVIAPLLDIVRAGKSTRLAGFSLGLRDPNGRLEQRTFDTDWSPIRDAPDTAHPEGEVLGALQTLIEVTDRRRAEAALRESETRHRLLVESWAQAMWESDADGLAVSDSPSWRAYTGQTVEEWLGYGWLDAIHPDDRAYAERQWRESIAARRPVDAEFRLRAPGGGWRWTNVRAAPVLDAHGTVEKWVGMNIDVNARKRAEAALRQSEAHNVLLVRFSDEVRGLSDPALIAEASCRLLTERLGTDRTLWATMDWEKRDYVAEWSFLADGTRAEPSRWPFDPREPFAADHLAGRSVVYEDSEADPRIPPPVAAAMVGQGLRAGIAVPVLVAGKLRAVLSTSRSTAPHRWDVADVAFVEVLAGRAWAEIERARAETALRQGEAQFRTLADTAPALIWQNDAEGGNTFANRHFLDFSGWSAAAIAGDGWHALIHPDEVQAHVSDYLASVRDQRRWHSRGRLRRHDGAWRWFENYAQPLFGEDGRYLGHVGVSTDVTAVVEAGEALRVSEGRFRGFAENSADVLWIANATGTLLEYLSPAFERMFGTGRNTVMADPRRVRDLVHPDDRALFDTAMPRALAGETTVIHYRVTRPGNRFVHLRDTRFLIHDDAGTVRQVAGVVQDVSDIAAAQADLEAEKERFRTLAEGIPQLVWRSGDDGLWTWSSPQWQAYTGQTQPGSHGWGWTDAIHPDDREATSRAWHEAGMHGELDVECRVRRIVDGAWRWHQTRSVPVRGAPTMEKPKGRILEWLGTMTDIEDLKRLQTQQQVLVAELQHRTRNLLGVVRNIARRSIEPSVGREEFDARLAALGRVQGFLSRSPLYTVSLGELVEAELEAAGNGVSHKVVVQGPAVQMPGESVQTVALALHELATNAVKYGAIAQPSGRLSVTWQLQEDAGGRSLVIDWHESGVTMPTGPVARRGYGSELITRALPYQLRAETALAFTPDGVRCRIVLPAGAFNNFREIAP